GLCRGSLKDNGHFLIITANPGAYSAWTGLYGNTKLDGRRFEGTAQHPDGLVSPDVLYLHSLDEIAHAFETAHCTVEGIETFRAFDGSAGEGKFVLVKGRKRPSIGAFTTCAPPRLLMRRRLPITD